jgi:hypothetical protein
MILIFYLDLMRASIYGSLLLVLLAGAVLAQGEDTTTLTYFVDYEEEQEDDFIAAELLIQSQSVSLTQALGEAKQVMAEVTSIANEFCSQNKKKGKGDCK